MERTIKEIADNININKQRVYRYIKSQKIKEAYQENGVLYYDAVVEDDVKRHFIKKTKQNKKIRDTHHSSNSDANDMHHSSDSDVNDVHHSSDKDVNDTHHRSDSDVNDVHHSNNSDVNDVHHGSDSDVNDTHHSSNSDVDKMIIETLRDQLKVKDCQILEKDQQIKDLLISLNMLQSTLRDTQSILANSQALHAGTIQQQLTNNASKEDEKGNDKDKKWWRFWK